MQVARYQAIALLLTGLAGLAFWYALPTWTRANAEEMLADGQKAVRDGDSASADKVVNQLVVLGYCEHAALLRGEILYRKGQFERAKTEFHRIEESTAIYPQASAFLGYCLLRTGDLAAAEEKFKKALDAAGEDVEANRGLADIYMELGATSRALEQLEIVAKLDPADVRPWMHKANFHAESGNFYESIKSYKEALTRSKNTEEYCQACLGLAESLLKHGQHLSAQGVLADLPESHRKCTKALILRAEAHAQMGEFNAARETIAPVLNGPSPCSSALMVAGKIEFESGSYDRAIKYLEVAAYDPAQFEARYMLAQALNKIGERQASEKLLTQADLIKKEIQNLKQLSATAGIRPWDRSVRERLAEISVKLGKKEIAEKWRRAAKICPPKIS